MLSQQLPYAAVVDIGERIGVRILRYAFSEPQHGEDVCDRIVCPMKASIRRYCDEGHDILTADNMHRTLCKGHFSMCLPN